jgi:hypothetical protein
MPSSLSRDTFPIYNRCAYASSCARVRVQHVRVQHVRVRVQRVRLQRVRVQRVHQNRDVHEREERRMPREKWLSD